MISLSTVKEIVFAEKKLILKDQDLEKIDSSYNFVKEFSKDKIIYGINTGFGPMAQYRVADADLQNLQYNIIRSHSAGTGALIPPEYVKAILLARLSSFLTGHSGVHLETVDLLMQFINRDINPLIYEHGSVGASGDLVQMAHVALAMIGEGEVFYQGEIRATREVLEIEKLKPLKIYLREGLALLNGTSAMTGIGAVNILYAKKILRLSILASAFMAEITHSFDDYFSAELNNSKLHQGQTSIANELRRILSDSSRIRQREEVLYKKKNEESIFTDKIQEYYSIRCTPQILGPILDELSNCEKVLENEINSANDNPIIDVESGSVFHGGNFHGDYISYEMDKLKIAITRLVMLSERQLNYLCHEKVNSNLLPPFLNLGILGLNYGLQACQFTATSTTAECQTLSFPNYVHSIPCNNDNQDIVSMGTNSALICKKVIDNAFQVLAIQYMAIAQAITFLKIEQNLSKETKEMYIQIREIFPAFKEDKTFYNDIKAVIDLFKSNL